jgi:hypothetical protein
MAKKLSIFFLYLFSTWAMLLEGRATAQSCTVYNDDVNCQGSPVIASESASSLQACCEFAMGKGSFYYYDIEGNCRITPVGSMKCPTSE